MTTKTLEELLHAYNQLESPDIEQVFNLFKGQNVVIRIEAPNFHGTVTGDVGKAISDLQTNLQRLWCFALHDSENLVSDPAIRKSIVLAFQVSEGSTNLLESISSILDKLKSIKGVQEMKPWHWLLLGMTLIISFASYEAYEKTLDHEKEILVINTILESAKNNANKHDEELLKLAFSKQTENVVTIARSVPQATGLVFGSKYFSESELNTLRKPSSKEEAVMSSKTGEFIIFQVCNLRNNDLQIKIREISTNEEFFVRVDNDLFSEPDTYEKIWEYAKNKTKINLQISEARKSSGSVYRLEAIDVE